MADARAESHVFPVAEDLAHPSALEREVVEHFDQMRERLLRYLLGFGLSMQDCEEIVQETFLALFRHLQRGRSRRNLRGWLFRVAHILGLRKRQRTRLTEEIGDSVIDPTPNPEDQFATILEAIVTRDSGDGSRSETHAGGDSAATRKSPGSYNPVPLGRGFCGC